MCSNHFCNKKCALIVFATKKCALVIFATKKVHKIAVWCPCQNNMCCFCNVLTDWLARPFAEKPRWRHVINWLRFGKIWSIFCKVSKPNYCSTNKWECFGANSFSKHCYPVHTRLDYDGNRLTKTKGLASYCKAETTFTFYFTILPLSRAFLSINNREMKSESGFSFAMASKPFSGDGGQVWIRIHMKMGGNYSWRTNNANCILGHYTILGHKSEFILVHKQSRK